MKQKIAVILGSKNDMEKLQPEIDIFKELKIEFELEIISAHRHAEKLREYCLAAKKNGIEIFIAVAGMAAALPGAIAALVDVPVIGVAMKGGLMDGLDAVMAMVSIPKGLGVCCSGVGSSGFVNAMLLALQICALIDKKSKEQLEILKAKYK